MIVVAIAGIAIAGISSFIGGCVFVARFIVRGVSRIIRGD